MPATVSRASVSRFSFLTAWPPKSAEYRQFDLLLLNKVAVKERDRLQCEAFYGVVCISCMNMKSVRTSNFMKFTANKE